MSQDFEIQIHEGKKILSKYNGSDINVCIPDGIEMIGRGAFYGCSFLSSVQIPNSVLEIGESAFCSCPQLKAIILPKGIKKISQYALESNDTIEIGIYYRHETAGDICVTEFDCHKIFYLLDEKHRKIGSLYTLRDEMHAPFREFVNRLLSGFVDHLSEYDSLFFLSTDIIFHQYRAAICRLQLPFELEDRTKAEYIQFLKNNHQYFNFHKLIENDDIATISFLASLGAIPKEEIMSLINLSIEFSKVAISAILLNYKEKTWGHEATLSHGLHTKQSKKIWDVQDNVDGSVNITRYLGNKKSVIIPAKIKGRKVKRIAGRLGSLRVSIFYVNGKDVRSVVIEDGIEVIDDRAFLECTHLESVEIPESVRRIGREAFSACQKLISVIIPKGVTEIGDKAFAFCTSLTSVYFSGSVIKIEPSAFEKSPGVIIHAPKDSYAIAYAQMNEINYVES